MSRIAKAAKNRMEMSAQGWPVVVYFALFCGGFLGYLIGRIALAGSPHPLHWLSGVVGAILGTLAGWVWHQTHGDII